MNTSASPRATTRVDELADSYFDSAVELSPIEATSLGVPGQDEMLDDFSPEGYERISELRRTTLSALRTVTAEDDVDEVTIAAMTERL